MLTQASYLNISRKKTILVVEDEPDLRDLLFDELKALGYNVALAANGQEGLDKMQETEPDLILCDRSMPEMSGYEMLERIRGIYPQYKDVPFVFITALTDARDKFAVSDLEPAGYLEKPIDFDHLQKFIEDKIQ